MTERAEDRESTATVKEGDKLTFSNHHTWCKWVENDLSRFGDACTEFITRVHTVYPRHNRSQSVSHKTDMDDGTVMEEVRAWVPALDDPGLKTKNAAVDAQYLKLKSNTDGIWSAVLRTVSAEVQAAAALDPSWPQLRLVKNSLELYVLLEKICLAQNLNNSEAFRTQWQNLRWHPGDDIHQFFIRFEQAIASICNAHCTGDDAVQDPDKVFRLKMALPKVYSEKLLWHAWKYSKENPAYPKYATCKSDVTVYISNENKMDADAAEETRVGNALSAQRNTDTPKGNRGGKPRHEKKQTTTTSTTQVRSPGAPRHCYNCDSALHLVPDCPEPDVTCGCCKKPRHMDKFCKFNPLNPFCYADIKDKAKADKKRGLETKDTSGAKKGGRTYMASAEHQEEEEEEEITSDTEMPGNYLARSGSAMCCTIDLGGDEGEYSDEGEYDEDAYDLCDDICDDNDDCDEDEEGDDYGDEGDDRDDCDEDGEGDDGEGDDGEGDDGEGDDGEGDDNDDREDNEEGEEGDEQVQEAGFGLTQAESALVARFRMTPAPPRVRMDLPADTQTWDTQEEGEITVVVNGMRITGSPAAVAVIMQSVSSATAGDLRDQSDRRMSAPTPSQAGQDTQSMRPVVAHSLSTTNPSHPLSTANPLLTNWRPRAADTPGPQTSAPTPAQTEEKQGLRGSTLEEPRALTRTEKGEMVADMQEKIRHSYSTTKSALADETLEWQKSGDKVRERSDRRVSSASNAPKTPTHQTRAVTRSPTDDRRDMQEGSDDARAEPHTQSRDDDDELSEHSEHPSQQEYDPTAGEQMDLGEDTSEGKEINHEEEAQSKEEREDLCYKESGIEDYPEGHIGFMDIRRMIKSGEMQAYADDTHKIAVYPPKGKDSSETAQNKLYRTVMPHIYNPQAFRPLDIGPGRRHHIMPCTHVEIKKYRKKMIKKGDERAIHELNVMTGGNWKKRRLVAIGYRVARTRDEYERRRKQNSVTAPNVFAQLVATVNAATSAPKTDTASPPHSAVSTESSQVPHMTQAAGIHPIELSHPPMLTTNDSEDEGDDDDDEDSGSDKTSSTDSAVNYATQRDIHANTLRMERVKADDDGRTHPDYPDRIEPGSPIDVILCGNGRAMNAVVTLLILNEWCESYREMEDKDIVWHLPDPASIPMD
jgi:hypothetical protein